MNTGLRSAKIPLPFATAALGLCLSFLFPKIFGPISATLIGFALGVLLLYLYELQNNPTSDPEGRTYAKCPNCGNPVDCGNTEKR
jgi:hypothetical protein